MRRLRDVDGRRAEGAEGEEAGGPDEVYDGPAGWAGRWLTARESERAGGRALNAGDGGWTPRRSAKSGRIAASRS